ncbi:MAG: hypothetical protein KC594_10900 [Nitrospira sp.]|nr:hypothetical protein [Nitrospira sp.]
MQALAKRQNTSRAELIRQAVERNLEAHQKPIDDSAVLGIWKSQTRDAIVIENQLRSEWGIHERRPRRKYPD